MRIPRWISGNTQKDIIWNEEIRLKIGVAPINEKMRESHLRWFGYMQRRVTNAPIRTSEFIQVEETKKGRGRPKITLVSNKKVHVN